MRVRIEIDVDDKSLSIEQNKMLTGLSSGSGTDLVTFAGCVGQMISALSTGSSMPIDDALTLFFKSITLAAKGTQGLKVTR